MKRTTFGIVLAAITLLALIRVAATHRVFAQTLDEPVHLISGYDWLHGDYGLSDIEHPPLARALMALPFVKTQGVPPPASPDWIVRGNSVLYSGNTYERNLQRARMGTLLFLALAIVVTGLWGRHVAGPWPGLIAAAIVSALPPVLGHAGLATTDMAGAATVALALYIFTRWLDAPNWKNAIRFGLAAGLALLAKFSALLFFPAGALPILALRSHGFRWRGAVVAIVIAFVCVWAGYQFDVGTVADAGTVGTSLVQNVTSNSPTALYLAKEWPIPAPLFVQGLFTVKSHDRAGHKAFLLGLLSQHGWWYYFPVATFFKTPLAVFALVAAGLLSRRRDACEPFISALLMLAVAATASINIGVRHVLAMFPPLAVCCAIGAQWLWSKGKSGRAMAIVLAAWLTITSIAAHPDYLAWFNLTAGKHPERILGDSNLDWGQDVLRLRRVVRELGIEHFYVLLMSNADLEQLGFPRHEDLKASTPVAGWVIISESVLQLFPGAYTWLDGQPYRRVGKSIRIYDTR